MRAVPLRIVGSGFCPILSQRERRGGARWAPPFGGGLPRAMLAPDTSVGKAEIRAMVSILMLSFFNFELTQCFLTIPLLKLFLCYNINRSRRRLTFISMEV